MGAGTGTPPETLLAPAAAESEGAAVAGGNGDHELSELAAVLRPSLLRLTRIIRNQRVDTSVTLTQLSAINILWKKGPMSAGELAAQERVQPPSMTKVLASLEERGLVRREVHPDD